MYVYKYPRPALTVDCVIFGLSENENALKVLLIERADEPFKGMWALPGGFVNMEETLDQAARRELEEETGLKNAFIEQLYTFGDPDRDPRGRVVSVAYYALVNLSQHSISAGSDARRAEWHLVTQLPPLAFDHHLIFCTALKRLQGKVRYQPIGFELLPEKFALSQLQRVYEIILGKELDKRNFRKKILSMGLLVELPERQKGVPHRAAKLYRFDKEKYRQLESEGFMFEI
ncbi:MAG: NUDIX domain-containing protein [Cytophagales bacterium]|nr:NUDIX hydrolase [Bernardetiaceae bacterium]MDW8210934.1 NUDIX domain-containing protein [Cytophagales bacterium]